MFNILLYSRVLITIVLVWLILYYIFNRFRQLGKKKDPTLTADNSVFSSEKIQQAMQEEMTEIPHDEDMIQDDDMHEDMAEAFEIEEVVEIIEIQEEPQEEEVEVDEPVTEPEPEPVQEEIPEPTPVQIPIASAEWVAIDTDAPVKQYEYLFAWDETSPEVPKDLDAGRNIWQWHSRDDIVRDKFEKHIQKIRYEVGILKQRNDILWYEKKLVEWITLLPNDIDFQKQLADLYFHQGKYKKAQSLLKKILIDNPSDHYALWQVGEIATVEGNNEDAYLYLQQAYATCEDNPKYCFSLAQWYYDHDALDQALPLMEKMVKLRPKNIDYIVSLSHVQHKMWMTEQARQSLLRALELDPMNVTLKNYLKSL